MTCFTVHNEPWYLESVQPQKYIHKLSKAGDLSLQMGEKAALRHLDLDFTGGSVVKGRPANAGDIGSIPGPGRFHMPQSS
ncbi:hypothetical protein MJT46_003353 [Ovis ammon polii x Ovis aries]|nr:hypothetical protein MJT46_003353 [Ovis ammon polii x Ovis aries]